MDNTSQTRVLLIEYSNKHANRTLGGNEFIRTDTGVLPVVITYPWIIVLYLVLDVAPYHRAQKRVLRLLEP